MQPSRPASKRAGAMLGHMIAMTAGTVVAVGFIFGVMNADSRVATEMSPDGILEAVVVTREQVPANASNSSTKEASTDASSEWMCHHYVGMDQGNEWCKNAGVIDGFEIEFFGADGSPCGECWCCKRPYSGEGVVSVGREEDPEDGDEYNETTEEEQLEHDMQFWIDKCAWSGTDDCSQKKCCNQEGYQCFKKDTYFAGCQLSAPEDWDGEVLGGFRGWEASQASEGHCLGHSLWCLTVVTTGEEQSLLDAQRENGVGIFQCDAHAIFQGAPAPMGDWKSLANTDVFIDVWENSIKQDENWKKHDWTVKVDVDLVFFPDRLRWHIDNLCAPKKTGVYLKNTDFKWGFLGSLEVFSSQAMQMYYQVGWKCAENIGHNSGEDGYMKGCMDALGVASMSDTTLLDDKYTRGGFSGWGPGNCQNGATVGFHPYKTEWVWESCHDAAMRISDGPDIKCLAMGC